MRRVEPRSNLVSDALVEHEPVRASRSNGALVQTHSLGIATLEARDLGRHERELVAESRRIVPGPIAQSFPVRGQELTPRGLLVGGSPLEERRYRQSSVTIIVEKQDLCGLRPERLLGAVGCRESLGVVS